MQNSPQWRIVIVDDHQLVVDGLKTLIERETCFKVTGTALSGEEGFARIESERPDLAIIDISLKDFSGLELIRRLRERGVKTHILVLSMYEESVYAHRVRSLGADGYLMKETAGEQLLGALRSIARGEKYFSDRLEAVSKMEIGGSGFAVDLLSARELEIFQLLGRGRETRQIAADLGLSPKTVDAHCANIKLKLGFHNFTKLLHCATLWESRQGFL